MSDLDARPTECGFTLLELLIAMTLLSMLTLVLFGGLRVGARLWERTETSVESNIRIRLARAELQDGLARAYPELIGTATTNPHIYFEGTPHSVSFLGPDPEGSGQLIRTSYVLDNGPAGGSLIRTMLPELADGPSRSARRVLLPRVSVFTLSYFGPTRPGSTSTWQPEWRDKWRLPLLVRARLQPEGAKATQPDLIVAPRLSGDATCRYDVLTGYCQGRS